MNSPVSIAWCGPTDNYWNWITNHFQSVRNVGTQELNHWIESGVLPQTDTPSSTVLVIASDDRFDSRLNDLAQQAKHRDQRDDPSATNWCLLLGQDWAGHRRTKPSAETWHSFYWYELYDRFIPWLVAQSESIASAKNHPIPTKTTEQIKRSNPRTQRWIDAVSTIVSSDSSLKNQATALVVTHTEVTRTLWADSLSKRNVHSVAVTPDRLDVWMTPDWIIVDLDKRPIQIDTPNDGEVNEAEWLVSRLNQQFTDSLIAIADAFPRWENWQRLMNCGAHVPFGKPYFMDGLLDTMRRFE